PMLEKEELRKFFIKYLGYYYDLNQTFSKEAMPATQQESSLEDLSTESEKEDPLTVSGYSLKRSQFNKYKMEKQRVAETQTPVAVKESQSPKEDQRSELLNYLENHGLEYVDHRPKGGSLWVMGDKRIEPYLKPLEEEGIRFRFKAVGGRASKGRPAWFWYD